MSYGKEVEEFVKQCEKITTTYYDAYNVERVVSLVDVVDGLLCQFDLEQLALLPKLLSIRSEDVEFSENATEALLTDHVNFLKHASNDLGEFAYEYIAPILELTGDANTTLRSL